MLKTRFYSNYFTCYSGTDTQGSQELKFYSKQWAEINVHTYLAIIEWGWVG